MRSTKARETTTSLQEKAQECREHGYLLSSKRIGAGAFSKVYLGYATPSKICQNYKLSNDLRSKNHNMVKHETTVFCYGVFHTLYYWSSLIFYFFTYCRLKNRLTIKITNIFFHYPSRWLLRSSPSAMPLLSTPKSFSTEKSMHWMPHTDTQVWYVTERDPWLGSWYSHVVCGLFCPQWQASQMNYFTKDLKNVWGFQHSSVAFSPTWHLSAKTQLHAMCCVAICCSFVVGQIVAYLNLFLIWASEMRHISS